MNHTSLTDLRATATEYRCCHEIHNNNSNNNYIVIVNMYVWFNVCNEREYIWNKLDCKRSGSLFEYISCVHHTIIQII